MQQKNIGFCNRLRDYRARHKMPKYILGLLVGVSDVSIGKWERGDRIPSAENLSKLAEIMDMTMDDLWRGRIVTWTPIVQLTHLPKSYTE